LVGQHRLRDPVSFEVAFHDWKSYLKHGQQKMLFTTLVLVPVNCKHNSL
jgi:hypothetical protein